ncbi:MAG TPA: NUDIX domain-containing protein [Jiangellaceae bacterium]|nr:NUDIX domain-containing protein [Jiangellaceae bacterium]
MVRLLHRTDGDGWVTCACGHRHWGRFGAAGLLLIAADGAALLQHRAEWSHHGGTWGVPGGARSSAEPATAAALREAEEEAAVRPNDVTLSHTWVDDHQTWSYTTVVGHVPYRVPARPSDPESKDIRWVPVDKVTDLPLHPGFAAAWSHLHAHAPRRLVLLVDVANVMGSRPDGWWHDRLGAATRLRDQIAGAARDGLPAGALGLPGAAWWPEVHLVVEGQARRLPPATGVEVHAAERDGDQLLTELAAAQVAERPDDHIIAVTADRELRGRLQNAGAAVVGPSAVLDALP